MSRLRVTSNAPTDKSNGPTDPGARCCPACAFDGVTGRQDPRASLATPLLPTGTLDAPRGPTARRSPAPPHPTDHGGGRVGARSSVLACAGKPSCARPTPLVQLRGPSHLEEEAAHAGGRLQVLPLPSRCFGKCRTRGKKVPGISPRGAWIFLFKKKKIKKINKSESNLLIKV